MVIVGRVNQTVSWKREDLFMDRMVQGLSTTWWGGRSRVSDQEAKGMPLMSSLRELVEELHHQVNPISCQHPLWRERAGKGVLGWWNITYKALKEQGGFSWTVGTLGGPLELAHPLGTPGKGSGVDWGVRGREKMKP